MSHLKQKMFSLACTLCATAACSQTPHASPTDSASADGADAVAVSAHTDDSETSSFTQLDCSRVFTPNDAAGILRAPITLSRNQGSLGCEFENGSDRIEISRGLDLFNDEMEWNDVTVSSDRTNFVDLPGVGDQARRRASNGNEVMSKKGKIYCIVSRSDNTGITVGTEDLARRLGALCNKLFAASP